MSRTPLVEVERAAAAAVLELVVERKAPKQRSQSFSRVAIARALDETRIMSDSGEWNEATPKHLVALYALLHEYVYGVVPSEVLSGKQFQKFTLCAGSLVKAQFDGQMDAALEFMRWCWNREKSREEYRRKTGKGNGRLTPWTQFCGAFLVTDYRIERFRRNGGS